MNRIDFLIGMFIVGVFATLYYFAGKEPSKLEIIENLIENPAVKPAKKRGIYAEKSSKFLKSEESKFCPRIISHLQQHLLPLES